jgi:arylsulfatase A-like enzyme
MRAYHWNLEILSSVTALAKSVTKRAAGATAIGAVIAGLALGGSGCGGDAPRSAPPGGAGRRNLLVVVIDTLRRDHLSLYGYAKPTSPGLTRFAASSFVFERAMAASSWTEPSTASLLSGLTPPRHGAHEYARVPAAVTMLAEVLHDAGWRTGAVSGNPNASPLFGFDQGFESFHFPGNDEAREYPDVAELVLKAREFIQTADPAGRPFFCYLHVMNVHGPYVAPPEYRERFLDRPFTDFPFQNELWKEILRKGRIERRKEVTPEMLRDLTARYDGAIAYTDRVISDFLAERLAAGGASSDLIVVTSDHGEELFDHGGFGHGFSLHHELVDVPLLLRRPDGEGGGTRIAAPVSLVDVAPTLLDRLGLLAAQPGARFGDGVSLAPLLQGGRIERDAPIVAQLERGKQGKAFLLEQWPLRLILTERDYAGREDVLELFDLEKDPDERHDLLAGDAARTAELRRKLAARRSQLETAALPTTTEELDEAMRRKMEALGYGSEKGGGR